MNNAMEVLLVRFTKTQRAKIRHHAKKMRISEAEYVRRCVEHPLYMSSKEKIYASHTSEQD